MGDRNVGVLMADWLKKEWMWDFHKIALNGYPGWELTKNHPAWVKLRHIHKTDKSSWDLCNAWDDVAQVRFYQRDYTSDGIPIVNKGEVYWSSWWFQTLAERDRFLAWAKEQGATVEDFT